MTTQLRAVALQRRVRLFISITIYSVRCNSVSISGLISFIELMQETGEQLKQTLDGIADNMNNLSVSVNSKARCHRLSKARCHQQDAGVDPSEVVVCMIFDGIEKMHHSMVDYLQHELLLLDPAVLKTKHMGLSVTMQLFERTVEMRQVRSRRQYSPPIQMMAAIKMRNGGKLNSHAWIMQGFCRQLNPKYLVLIDVGTIPKRKALLHLYRCMEEDPNVGGW